MSLTGKRRLSRGSHLPSLYEGEMYRPRMLAGLLRGLAGGLAATWVMTQFQEAWTKVSRIGEQAQPQEQEQQQEQQQGGRLSERMEGSQSTGTAVQSQPRQQEAQQEEEPATVKTARAIAEPMLQRELTEQEKQFAGPLVHYVYGSLIGAIYGALAEVTPKITVGAGSVYGAAAWLGGDELALPALGLAKRPTEYPLSTHVYALASHLVYGVTLEGVRRILESKADRTSQAT